MPRDTLGGVAIGVSLFSVSDCGSTSMSVPDDDDDEEEEDEDDDDVDELDELLEVDDVDDCEETDEERALHTGCGSNLISSSGLGCSLCCLGCRCGS